MKFRTFLIALLIFILNINFVLSLYKQELYRPTNEQREFLDYGDDNFAELRLSHPVYFYSEKYDQIFINTNGILSFKNPLESFLNIPFPLDYPAISVFYSNIDTSNANESTSIAYFESSNPEILSRASRSVQDAFSDSERFRATAVVIVTWENVGYFDGQNDLQNTFQVVIISNDEETFVQYLYPEDGINWVQADIGDDGLPVIRARVGFSTLDGRYFLLKESGTDNIRHLPKTSNVNIPGVWIFRVGPLNSANDNIEEPDVEVSKEVTGMVQTCSNKGNLKCHSSAYCQDYNNGFCCICKDKYYGNGYNCIKNDGPLRVTGKITGTVNNENIESMLQSYVVMADGRTYTAISPLSASLSAKMQLMPIIGTTLGWLFAKPLSASLNGYQITGGKFNHTIRIGYEDNNQMLTIAQKFNGLNLWDQLSVDIEINGEVPDIPEDAKVHIDDFVEEFISAGPNDIQSSSSQVIRIEDSDSVIRMSVFQHISFESCAFLSPSVRDNFAGRLKTSKTSIKYKEEEKALRIVMLSKIGVQEKSNRCNEGTANCGANTICVPLEDDDYECTCQNGYAPDQYYQQGDSLSCVDIDECSGNHICSEFAECINELGGYSCRCYNGYQGNGFICDPIPPQTQPPYVVEQTTSREPEPRPVYTDMPRYSTSFPEYHQIPDAQDQYYYQCDPTCGENAICYERRCLCVDGFSGDGYNCRSLCNGDQIFRDNECVDISVEVDDYEFEATCNMTSCSCPEGYLLVDAQHTYLCRWADAEISTDAPSQALTCDLSNICNVNAICQYNYEVLRYECLCKPGYEGDGYECVEIEKSCATVDICDPHASCKFDQILKKSVCVCNQGYEGNGISCQLAPECQHDDECGINSVCNEGLCVCKQGFERDNSDFCVLEGSCGGAYCAENAECRYDERQKVSYCYCPPEFIGDGLLECKSVIPTCNIKNNCGLFASCLPDYRNPEVYNCVCNQGYTGDGFHCTPEVNCQNTPSICDPNAECQFMSNGWQCICGQGFIGNGSYCKYPPKLDAGFLVISQGVAVVKIPLTGARGVPVSASSMAIAIDKDCVEGRLYFSDISSKAIFSTKYDGTDRKVFVDTNIISPEGVAVDWISRRLYWTDSGKDTVEVASLDNSTLRAVIINKHLVNPRGIAVDPLQGKLYWSDWNRADPKIESSNLDGTERKLLLSSPSVKLPNSLVISLNTPELCFADAGNQRIDCIDTYVNTVRTVAGNLSYPFGLAITEDNLYWSDWTTKKIESIDHYGKRSTGMQTPLFSNHKMYGMVAITEKCPIYYSPCITNNGDCASDRICLANNKSPSGKNCKCISSSACEQNLSDL